MEFLKEERDIWEVQKVQRLTINFSHGSHTYFEPYKACHVPDEKNEKSGIKLLSSIGRKVCITEIVKVICILTK